LGVLYIVSAEAGAGKTAICAGIATNLVNDGKKAGYLKPQAAEKGKADGDIVFMRKTLGQADIVNAPDIVAGRDIVLVEAMLGETANDPASKDAYGAAKDMQAKVIAVETYTGKPSKNAALYRGFGDSFLGIIINKVPQSLVKKTKADVAARAATTGVKVLGIIPENRTLLAITVAELAQSIKGKIISNEDNAGELVENYLLGALVPDSGTDYFKRKSNKAAVIRQERADMQLAALETPTTVLVLAGSSQPPIYNVLNKAKKNGVPIITTESDINDIVDNIETTIAASRINQDKKLAKLGEMVKQNLDMKVFG
jgi:BioD-like phosphotransacetylase family protein